LFGVLGLFYHLTKFRPKNSEGDPFAAAGYIIILKTEKINMIGIEYAHWSDPIQNPYIGTYNQIFACYKANGMDGDFLADTNNSEYLEKALSSLLHLHS
jgi:hypothetical protein